MTATRGVSRVQFTDGNGLFNLGADGTASTVSAVRATYYDGQHLIFGSATWKSRRGATRRRPRLAPRHLAARRAHQRHAYANASGRDRWPGRDRRAMTGRDGAVPSRRRSCARRASRWALDVLASSTVLGQLPAIVMPLSNRAGAETSAFLHYRLPRALGDAPPVLARPLDE